MRIVNFVMSVFTLLGIIFLAISIFLSKGINKKIKNCQSVTPGNVVDMVHDRIGRKHIGEPATYSWFPVYEYSVGGKIYRIKSTVGTSNPQYKVGDKVQIHYNADNPEEIYIKANEYSIIILIFRIVGAVLIVLSILLSAVRFFL